jgi:2,3-bisphosphoglycerate-independent phosphoglycerate mutase
MLNKETGQPHTAHTTAPVPFIMANTDKALRKDVQGALCDVAPTLLCVMGLPVPDEMTGQSLLVE